MDNNKSRLNGLIKVVDVIAAVLLGLVTVLTFVSVICRYVLNWPIPDSFDVGRLLLGIAVFWGIASATFRSEQIQVDILYEALRSSGKRVLNVIAMVCLALLMFGIIWMLAGQTFKVYEGGETTTDLLIPIWPFYAVAWFGAVLTFMISGAALWRYVLQGESE